MKGQTKRHSFYEALAGIAVGIIVNYFANVIILPKFFGITLPLESYGKLTLIYTAISIVRSYGLRRLFNLIHMYNYKPRYLKGNIEL